MLTFDRTDFDRTYFDRTDFGHAGSEAALQREGATTASHTVMHALLHTTAGWVAPSAVQALLYVDADVQVRRSRGGSTSGRSSRVHDLLGCMLGTPPRRPETVPRFLATVAAATFVGAASEGARSLAELADVDPVVPLMREVLDRDALARLRGCGTAARPGDWVPAAVMEELHVQLSLEAVARVLPQDDELPSWWLGTTLLLERCMERIPSLETSLAALHGCDKPLGELVEALLRARGWLPP